MNDNMFIIRRHNQKVSELFLNITRSLMSHWTTRPDDSLARFLIPAMLSFQDTASSTWVGRTQVEFESDKFGLLESFEFQSSLLKPEPRTFLRCEITSRPSSAQYFKDYNTNFWALVNTHLKIPAYANNGQLVIFTEMAMELITHKNPVVELSHVDNVITVYFELLHDANRYIKVTLDLNVVNDDQAMVNKVYQPVEPTS